MDIIYQLIVFYVGERVLQSDAPYAHQLRTV